MADHGIGETSPTVWLKLHGNSVDTLVPAVRAWLNDEDALRGHVRIERETPRPEEMGAWSDVIQVAVGSGGAVAALAGAIVYWLRTRTSNIDVSVRRADGNQITVSAQRIRRINDKQLSQLTNEFTDWLDGTQSAAPKLTADELEA